MSHDTTNKPAKQTSMFSIENAAPQIHNAELGVRRVQIDGTWFFSVIDIFKLYGDTTDARQEWKTVEGFLIKQGAIGSDWSKRSDVKNTQLLMHKFEGQGQRLTPIATFKMIMRIAQVTTFQGWEEARDQMAQLAEERVEETRNPELGIRRASDRFLEAKKAQGMTEDEAKDFLILVQEGHISRRQWTDVLRQVVRGVIQYGVITDAQYMILFGVKAKEIKAETGFKVARDGMTLLGRQITNACDIALMDEFKRHDNLTFPQAVELTKTVASDFSPTIKRIQERTGVSLATGRKLLGRGS